MKQFILNNLKNIVGWKTKRKIVVLSVDDYGNVRLHNKEARENLDKLGLKVNSRFDVFDTLETREDLEVLYETLTSVKDKNGRSAVFTTFAMPCNIDFEKVIASDFKQYYYELLPKTYEKLEALDIKAYKNTWSLWQEGIKKKILVPQFHGREHLNLKIFNENLIARDKEFISVLNNRSYTSISKPYYPTINYTAAFDFWDPKENENMEPILADGIKQFKEVFGNSPSVFMPPTSNIHQSHLPSLMKLGISSIDTNLIHKQHQGFGKYKTTYNFTGKKLKTGQINLVRNIVFEPTANNKIDWVNYSLNQIQAAFRFNKPAIVSSHRVNFCGHIEESNRKHGLDSLKLLLKMIIKKWPDVEFLSADELSSQILNKKLNVS